MLRKAAVAVVLFAVVIVFVSCGGKPSKEEMLEKGKYMVNAAGVLNYHTPTGKDGKPDYLKFMAGNVTGYQGPWGVFYPRNLTPDIDTGIGGFTDDEVINMIKDEFSSGKVAMFNDYYKNLTEEDLKYIVVYLRSLTPISNKIPQDLKPGEAPKTPVINMVPSAAKVEKVKTTAKPATTTKKPSTTKKSTTTKKTPAKK